MISGRQSRTKVSVNPCRMPPIVFKSKIEKEMKSTNTEPANAAADNSAPSKTNKTNKPKKEYKTHKNATALVPNAQVAKMLVGDEIARVSIRCEPILGDRTPEIGEMIAEKLTDQIDELKADLAGLVAEIDRESTAGDLARQWVEWREAKARAKENELEKRKLEAAAKVLAKSAVDQPDAMQTHDATPVTPSFPGAPPTASETGLGGESQSAPAPPAEAEKPAATATGQLALGAGESPEGAR